MRSHIRVGIGILGLAAVTLAGCSDAHQRTDDGGPVGGDAWVPPASCHPGDPPPWDTYFCVYVDANHVCGDAALSPECVDGAWRCPAGTSNGSECWCSGFGPHDPACTCTPSGWSCPPQPVDAGVDAPPECPADLTAAVGMPCALEGQSCGTCANPCSGFCNLITCGGGTWQTLDFGCADTTFACGPSTWCSRWSEYCEHVLSDVVGVPDDYRCSPFPADCANDCSCWADAPGAGTCTRDTAGGVTLTLGGG